MMADTTAPSGPFSQFLRSVSMIARSILGFQTQVLSNGPYISFTGGLQMIINQAIRRILPKTIKTIQRQFHCENYKRPK